MSSLLAMMVFDHDVNVRFHAAAAAARRVAEGRGDLADRVVVDRLVDADETLAADAILAGTRYVKQATVETKGVVQLLERHPAGVVRTNATLRLIRWQSQQVHPTGQG